MNRAVLFFTLFSLSLSLCAQNVIKGIVVDKDSKHPVSDVIVQYGGMSKDYDFTKDDGRYSIPESADAVISFQCIGYKARQIPLATLKRNGTVELEIDPVYLEPILISPKEADKLLEEAMINTKKKLVLDQSLCYLLHFLQTKSNDTLPNEVYLQYATTLTEKALKKSMKKEKIPYILNVMDIARIQQAGTPLSEMYGAEYHASYLFSFGKSVNNETTRRYTADSTLIILQIEPIEEKGGWARGEIVINREDMAILSMQVESDEGVLEDQPYKNFQGRKVKIIRKVGRYSFKKKNDRYYMSDCYTYYKFRAVDDNGREEESSFYCDVTFRGFVPKWQLRPREISGFCQELFYLQTSTQKPFWLENIIESEEAEIDRLTIDRLREEDEKVKKRRKIIKSAKGTAFVVIPSLLLIYLINKGSSDN